MHLQNNEHVPETFQGEPLRARSIRRATIFVNYELMQLKKFHLNQKSKPAMWEV